MKFKMMSALFICTLVLAGCPQEETVEQIVEQITVTVSAEDLVGAFSDLPQNDEAHPHTIIVSGGEISNWDAVKRAINNLLQPNSAFDIYVKLDLSRCTNTELSSESKLGSNAREISLDNLVGLFCRKRLLLLGIPLSQAAVLPV